MQPEEDIMAHHDSPRSQEAAPKGVPIVFGPLGGFAPDKVFVHFLGGGKPGVKGRYYNKSTGTMEDLIRDTPYSLAELTSPVSVGGGAPANIPSVFITSYVSGRIYISLNAPLDGLGCCYQPASANPNDPNYLIRYQYIEPTVDAGGMHVNMSYIDCAAIGLILTAVNAPHSKNSPLATLVNTTQLVTAAANAATPPLANVVPSPKDILPSPKFARVLPPMAFHDATNPNPLYHDWTSYLKTTLQRQAIHIQGCFAGSQVGGIPQRERLTSQGYDYMATVDVNGNVTMTAQKGSGKANPTCGGIKGDGIGDQSTVTITFAELNATNGIYGCDPGYTWSYVDPHGKTQSDTTSSMTNDVFGWVVGDLLAGLNFGFPGSAVTFNGIPLGGLSSTRWWGGTMPDGTVIDPANTPAGKNLLFDKAQPAKPTNYNTYAASLQGKATAYGFSLQDRLGQVLMEFDPAIDPNSYLMIELNVDQ